jgi:VIT1/CCC1 family predicted Fe2+/Mn2+ transporter
MNAWKRWQDWSVVVLGAILFVTPFVFAETAMTTAATSAYILGVLVFVSPWLFGFASVTALAWSAWIIGILLAVAVGSLYPRMSRRATA